MSEHADVVRLTATTIPSNSSELSRPAVILPFERSLRAGPTYVEPPHSAASKAVTIERRIVFIPEPETCDRPELPTSARIVPLRLSNRVLGYLGCENDQQAPTFVADRYRTPSSTPVEAEAILAKLFAEAEPYEQQELLPDVLLFASHYVRHAIESGEPHDIVCTHALDLLHTAIASWDAAPLRNQPLTDRLERAAQSSDTLTRCEASVDKNLW